MDALIIFSTLLSLGACGIIHHDLDFEHGDKATSYQSIHFQHFHPVPTYIKKQDKHLIEHPLPAGKTVSKVEIHHGDKHYPGYAIQSGSDDSHIFKADDDSASTFAELENSNHQEDHVGGGYQVQEDYHQQQQYYPQEALQQQPQHYQYIPKEQTEQHQGLSHYYSYPQEALHQTSFRHQPIVVAEQEKS